jgi:hypothetical protein
VLVILGNLDEGLLEADSAGNGGILEVVLVGLAFIFWGLMWVAYIRSGPDRRSTAWTLILLTGPMFGGLAYYCIVWLRANIRPNGS